MKQGKKRVTWLCLFVFCVMLMSSSSAMAASRQTTIKELLQTGLRPVGSTSMYGAVDGAEMVPAKKPDD